MDAHHAFARPRVGLLGNPSDLYGGKVVAFTFDAFETSLRLEPLARGIELVGDGASLSFEDWSALTGELEPRLGEAGTELLGAALRRLFVHAPALLELDGADPRTSFRITFSTDVPRQAGLSGSSAIVIAALRLLGRWFDVEYTPFELSELALAAETEDLGIVAGPQDRVVQSYGGLVTMDFTGARTAASYGRLDPALLPPLLVAWSDGVGASSGDVHHDVRERWLAGDARVREVMARYPALVERGVAALEARDLAGLADAVDENFDLRAAVFPVSDGDRRLIELGRAHGAATKFCGSGGSVLAMPRDPGALDELEAAYRDAGMRCLRPRVGPLEASIG